MLDGNVSVRFIHVCFVLSICEPRKENESHRLVTDDNDDVKSCIKVEKINRTDLIFKTHIEACTVSDMSTVV